MRWMKPQRKERMWDSKWIPFLVEGRNTWKNKREKGYWYTEHIDTGTVQVGASHISQNRRASIACEPPALRVRAL